MKNLILILLLLVFISCKNDKEIKEPKQEEITIQSSPTFIDYEVLNKINAYRISLHLSELKIDSNLQKGAEHHTKYLFDVNTDTLLMVEKAVHKKYPMRADEQSKVTIIRGHEELNGLSFQKRAKLYGIYKENVVTIFGYMDVSTYTDIMIDTWKKSPRHHETMIDPKMKYCGISTIIFEIDNKGTYTTITTKEGRTTETTIGIANVYIVSTMTFK